MVIRPNGWYVDPIGGMWTTHDIRFHVVSRRVLPYFGHGREVLQ